MQNITVFLPLILVFVLMYFLMIRPQQKQQRQLQEMRSNLKVGDEIITIGGIKGRVLKINDNNVIIESSNSKTRLEFVKHAISTVVSKTDSNDTIVEEEVIEETEEDNRD